MAYRNGPHLGIFNRDYMKSPSQGGPLDPTSWSGVQLLMVLNGAMFLLAILSGRSGLALFLNEHFRCTLAQVLSGQVWTLLTSVFFHKELFHLLFNMLVLFFFGRTVESDLGKRRFLIYYLIFGVAGSLFSCLLTLGPWFDQPILGASGAIAGVVVFYALTYPKAVIHLFGVLPMPAFVLAAILAGVDLVGLVMDLSNAAAGPQPGIAHGAHLGGMLGGLALFWLPQRTRRSKPAEETRRVRKRRRRVEPAPDFYHDSGRSEEEEARLDMLLAKVSEGGLDALTPHEREFLIEMSKKSPK